MSSEKNEDWRAFRSMYYYAAVEGKEFCFMGMPTCSSSKIIDQPSRDPPSREMLDHRTDINYNANTLQDIPRHDTKHEERRKKVSSEAKIIPNPLQTNV